jgi:hypothetical protein
MATVNLGGRASLLAFILLVSACLLHGAADALEEEQDAAGISAARHARRLHQGKKASQGTQDGVQQLQSTASMKQSLLTAIVFYKLQVIKLQLWSCISRPLYFSHQQHDRHSKELRAL